MPQTPIDQHDVCLRVAGGPPVKPTVVARHHRQIGALIEESRNPLAQHRVVLDDQQPELAHRWSPRTDCQFAMFAVPLFPVRALLATRAGVRDGWTTARSTLPHGPGRTGRNSLMRCRSTQPTPRARTSLQLRPVTSFTKR